METNHNNMKIENKDPLLWKLAQKRAAFKYHLLSYCIMNIFSGRYGSLTTEIMFILQTEVYYHGRPGQCFSGVLVYSLIISPHTSQIIT